MKISCHMTMNVGLMPLTMRIRECITTLLRDGWIGAEKYICNQRTSGINWGINSYRTTDTYCLYGNYIGFNAGINDFTAVVIFNDNGGNDHSYLLGNGGGDWRWNIGSDHSIGAGYAYLVQYNPSTAKWEVLGLTDINQYVRSNIVFLIVRQGNVIKTYINGELIKTEEINASRTFSPSGTNNIGVGGTHNAITYGALFYKRAITNKEIANMNKLATDYYNIILG